MTEWRMPRATWVGAGIGFLVFAAMAANIAAWASRGVGEPVRVFDAVLGLLMYVVAFVLLVVRPRVRVEGERVEVRNPFGTVRFQRADVVGTELTPFGLRFELADGTRPISAVFCEAAGIGSPDWRGCAEAVTGRPPGPPVGPSGQFG